MEDPTPIQADVPLIPPMDVEVQLRRLRESSDRASASSDGDQQSMDSVLNDQPAAKRARLSAQAAAAVEPFPKWRKPAVYPFVCRTCGKRYLFERNLESHKLNQPCGVKYDYSPIPLSSVHIDVKPPTPRATRRVTSAAASQSPQPEDSASDYDQPAPAPARTGRGAAIDRESKPFACICGKRYAYKESVYNHKKSGRCPGVPPPPGMDVHPDVAGPSRSEKLPAAPAGLGKKEAVQEKERPSGSPEAKDDEDEDSGDEASKPYVCDCGKRYGYKTSIYNHKNRGRCTGAPLPTKPTPPPKPTLLTLASAPASAQSSSLVANLASGGAVGAAAPGSPTSSNSQDGTYQLFRRRNAFMEDDVPRPYVCLVPGCGKAYKNTNGLAAHFSSVKSPGHGELGRRLRDEANGKVVRPAA